MRRLSLALGLLAACAATGAAAETVNLTGTYRCIQMCRNGMLGTPAFVTQNRDAVNLTTEKVLSGLARLERTLQPNLDCGARPGRRLFARWHAHSVR